MLGLVVEVTAVQTYLESTALADCLLAGVSD